MKWVHQNLIELMERSSISSVVQDIHYFKVQSLVLVIGIRKKTFNHVGKPNACGTNKENMLVMQMNQLIKVMPTKRVMIIYYDNWLGAHPAGRSKWCNGNSCIPVGIDMYWNERIINDKNY